MAVRKCMVSMATHSGFENGGMPTKLLISQLLLIGLELAIEPPPQNIYSKPHSYYTFPLTVKRRPDISNIISGRSMERRKIILQEKKMKIRENQCTHSIVGEPR